MGDYEPPNYKSPSYWQKVVKILLVALAAVSLFLGVAYLVLGEGVICLAIIVIPFLLLGVIGAVVVAVVIYYLQKNNKPKNYSFFSLIFVVIPFASMPIEEGVGTTEQATGAENHIDVFAATEVVWEHVVRVKAIRPDELRRTSLSLSIGFPRPIEAVLDTVAVGGIRMATFERGLYFKETVTEMEPLKVLRFDIHADPKAIPPTALDEHVTVGGQYFDVLEGCYRLEPIAGGVRLHLSSKFRVSTTLNAYAGMWCRWIMADIQENILHVVKARCEAESPK
jgi:energy-converting hydrogenase Eha subunit A